MKTTRKCFLKESAMALTAAVLAGQASGLAGAAENRLVPSFGFQTWTIRDRLVDDFVGTLRMMADLGYNEVEMCSPLGYSNAGFGPLNTMSGTEMRKIIEDAGLVCSSSHFKLGELRDSLDNRIEWAHQLGMGQMILSTFGLPADQATVDDYKRAAEELNKIAEKTRAAGIQMGFHNHDMEFQKRGDTLIYDALLDTFAPELVKMQFQVAVVSIGYQAADFFHKYPGRFISAHLADWSKEQNGQVPIGQGVVDWRDLFAAAKVGGVRNCFVEMDPSTFEKSAKYLTSL
mgnify:CR=1 FL=1